MKQWGASVVKWVVQVEQPVECRGFDSGPLFFLRCQAPLAQATTSETVGGEHTGEIIEASRHNCTDKAKWFGERWTARNCHQAEQLRTGLVSRGKLRGQPGGAAVKCTCSALATLGSLVRILGADMALLGKPCCGRRPTYKVEEDGHGC